MSLIPHERIESASPMEFYILQEVFKRREEYLDSRIMKAELVERK